jgi:hypothetical protein
MYVIKIDFNYFLKIYELMVEVSLSPPNMTMLGLVDIDLRLMPSVM